MTEQDRAFHNSFKPSWALDGTLVYGTASDAPLAKDGILVNVNEAVVSEGQDVQFARFSGVSRKVRVKKASYLTKARVLMLSGCVVNSKETKRGEPSRD